MIAEGHHKARAIASDIGVSQQKMTPFVKVTFATDSGEEVDWYGYVSDSPRAQEILVDSLRAMGFVGGADDLDQLAGLDQEQVGAFLPAQVSLKVEHEEFKGRTQARVRYVNPVKTVAPGGSIFSSLKAAFAAKPAQGAPPPPKPGPKARPEPQQVSDDDIPFLPHPTAHLSRPGGPGKPGPRARGVMKTEDILRALPGWVVSVERIRLAHDPDTTRYRVTARDQRDMRIQIWITGTWETDPLAARLSLVSEMIHEQSEHLSKTEIKALRALRAA